MDNKMWKNISGVPNLNKAGVRGTLVPLPICHKPNIEFGFDMRAKKKAKTTSK